MPTYTPAFGLLIPLSILCTSACRKQQPAPLPAPAIEVADDSARRDSLERAAAARRDSLARAERLRAEREERLAAARAVLAQPIYFDYDRADITVDSRGVLDAKLPILSRNQELRLRITGHADERGSDEYNLALGQARAAAAKRYLLDHGIEGSRVDVLSLGEERPVCTSADESCWRRNRRAEFELTAGGETITIPYSAASARTRP